MILDELIGRFPVLAPLGTQGVVKVPFPVVPDDPAQHVPRGLIPMDGKTVLLGSDAKAPWPVTVLVSERPERGLLVVRAIAGEDGTDRLSFTRIALEDQITIAHYPGIRCTKAGDLLGPDWFAACLIWTAAHHPELAETATRHLRVAKEVAPGTAVSRGEMEDGIRARWTDAAALLQSCGEHPIVPDPAQLSDEDLTLVVGQIMLEAHAAIITASATFALFNTKNVVTRLVKPSVRAFLRRGERPPVAYHEILWRPFGTKAERLNGSLYSGNAVAVNWARGHFKTYSAERPLFGQHVGRFWWQRHQRGLDRLHRIESTYRLSVTAEVAS